MKRQRVIITLNTGDVVTFTGPAQVDTSRPIKVVRFQFSVPREETAEETMLRVYGCGSTAESRRRASEGPDESFEDIFGGLLRAMSKGDKPR